jgi:phage terminase small subunit
MTDDVQEAGDVDVDAILGTRTLNPRQLRFIDEYVVDLSPGRAAVRAGYSLNGADVQGHRLLKNAKIATAIQKKKEELAERTGVTQEWVVEKLAENHEACMERTKEGLTHAPSAANKSLELLGKHVGMFQEARDAPAAIMIQVNMHPHGDDAK